MVARGEIWWCERPASKRRPFLVITRDAAIPVLTKLLAVPVTRRARGIPTEVELDESDGMPTTSVLSLDNIEMVPKAFLTHRVTTLGPERMHKVCEALRIATGC